MPISVAHTRKCSLAPVLLGVLLAFPLAILTLSASVSADPLFSTKTDYSTGTGPVSVAIADLNSDGKPDIAAATAAGVTVWFGHGDGTLGGRIDFAAGNSPRSVAIGDFNADGKPDLAVANYTSHSASVFLGNGDGTFGAKTDYFVGTGALTVAIGEFNGDGKPDLAVAFEGRVDPGEFETPGGVTILLGSGSGFFPTRIDNVLTNHVVCAAVGEFNGDGKQDLAAAGCCNTVWALLGNGNGTVATGQAMGVFGFPGWVTVGDLNGDGRQDLVAANVNTARITVMLGNGDGTFAAGSEFGTAASPEAVAIGNLDSDGRPDLAVANTGTNTVSVLAGNGDGTFATRVDFATGGGPRSVAIADLNSDGRQDLVLANAGSNTVSVLLGIAGATPVQMSLVGIEATPERVSLRWQGEGAASLVSRVYRRVSPADWEDLGSPVAEGADALLYEDRGVTPGVRYIYRLGYKIDAAEFFTPEIEVEVPGELQLALDGFRPNPALGAPLIAFTLADATPATVEIMDVAGRRILRRDIVGLGAGRHIIRLEQTARLSPGFYLIRLRQAGRDVLARGTVIQ